MRRAQRGIPSKVHGLEFRWLYHDNLTKEPEDFRLLDIPRIGRTLCVHRSVDRLLGRAAYANATRLPVHMRACAKGYVSGLAPFPARPRQLVVYALVRSLLVDSREYPLPRSISRDFQIRSSLCTFLISLLKSSYVLLPS